MSLLNDSQDLSFYDLERGDEGFLNPLQMANLFTNSALLVTITQFLKEQLWLRNKQDRKDSIETSYENFILPFFSNELKPIIFLKEFFIIRGVDNIIDIGKDAKIIEGKVLSLMMERLKGEQKTFAIESLKIMTLHFLNEESEQDDRLQSLGHKGLRLYRTFDNLDDIFDLDYQIDQEVSLQHTTSERLYQGGGVGVQSGYSTILLALHHLKADQNSKVVDLGSGYGRVGLVCSLLRPDMNFKGFEFVSQRVDISNKASTSLGLEDKLSFITQDLSLESFKIPDADIYYLYDPFTRETYDYILKQIVEVSKRRRIAVVTKGNARDWLMKIAKDNNWEKPILIDEGNLCIFNSCSRDEYF